ncbi:MAG: glycosyltransferase family 4 protein [Pseudomonadota bacterium]
MSAKTFDRMKRLSSIAARRKIVDFDDIESINIKRALEFSQNGFELDLIQKIAAWRFERAENRLLRTYDDVLVCSDLDKKTLQKKALPATIHALPNSVPLQPVMPPLQARDTLHILFVGLMHYGPNRDGAIWFCKEILPLIRKQSKARCRLWIVGYGPPGDVAALAEEFDDVVVTGGVESVAPYYDDCDLVIAPIRFGGGTRIKILEAMSYQKPVVTTMIGAEGIDIKDGLNIMIGDSPESFASACVSLLESASLRHTMGQEGRKCIEEKYSAGVVSDTLNRILDS